MNRMAIAKFYCLALVLVLASGLGNGSTQKVPHLKKRYVKFVNNLDNKVLNVNCKNQSPYIDLSLHILLPKENYEFNYDVTPTVAFNCELRHGFTTKVISVSDRATRRQCGGNHCIWKAEETGLYLLNRRTNQYAFKYGWGK